MLRWGLDLLHQCSLPLLDDPVELAKDRLHRRPRVVGIADEQHRGASILAAEAVHIEVADPRQFLRAPGIYDLVLVGMPEPTSGGTNRFFTLEFFTQCAKRLSPEGVLGFRIYRQASGQEHPDNLNGSGLLSPDARSFADESVRVGETYSYTLGVVLADNSELLSPSAEVTVGGVALVLEQNHPNPFNPRTTISFTLPQRGHVRLAIYSADGRLVRTLIDETTPAGFREVPWDGKDDRGATVSSGVYFYRLESGKQTLARKMVYLK